MLKYSKPVFTYKVGTPSEVMRNSSGSDKLPLRFDPTSLLSQSSGGLVLPRVIGIYQEYAWPRASSRGALKRAEALEIFRASLTSGLPPHYGVQDSLPASLIMVRYDPDFMPLGEVTSSIYDRLNRVAKVPITKSVRVQDKKVLEFISAVNAVDETGLEIIEGDSIGYISRLSERVAPKVNPLRAKVVPFGLTLEEWFVFNFAQRVLDVETLDDFSNN